MRRGKARQKQNLVVAANVTTGDPRQPDFSDENRLFRPHLHHATQIQRLSMLATPIIGREREIQLCCDLLKMPQTRLLTLSGPGGVGKTRLALQVAVEVGTLFADGIRPVSLASVHSPDMVAPAITRELGLKERYDFPPLEMIKELLRDRHCLLLLDNFEQVVAAAPQLAELLSSCQQLKLLVTSRAALRLREEYELPITPLELPDLVRLPTYQLLARQPAVALFVQRASAVLPEFTLSETNAPAIAEICVRLDGLPLALELAAARMKIFSPQGLLVRLGCPLEVLSGETLRDLPTRQQTLRRTIAWSYHLLQPLEQRLFRRLAVFAGGCTLDAMEGVCSDLAQSGQILDAVTALIDQNLLRAQRSGIEEEPRFNMLATIREYALECLARSDEEEATRQAHAMYYLKLAEETEQKLIGPEQSLWMARLEREHHNLRSAVRWLLDRRDVESALRLCGALWTFWIHMHAVEGYYLTEEALELSQTSSGAVDLKILARATYSVTRLAHYGGITQRQAEFSRQYLDLMRTLGDKEGIAIALNTLGQLALVTGDGAALARLTEESVPLLRSGNNRWRLAEGLYLSAFAYHLRGEHARALALAEECLALCQQIGEPQTTLRVLHALGLFACYLEDAAALRRSLDETLRLVRSFIDAGDLPACATGLMALGGIAAALDQIAWAIVVWSAAKALYDTIDVSMARLEPLAWVAAALRTRMGYTGYEKILAALPAQLGARTLAHLWNQGKTMPLASLLVPFQGRDIRMPPLETLTGDVVLPAAGKSTAPGRVATNLKTSSPAAINLTAREIDVLRLLSQGLTSAQIAQQLTISTQTVNSHIRSIYSKLDVNTRSAATRYAIEQKLV
ncbi:MAG: hypothetical protein IMW89_08260 [Ktedonobacteraceae bacterium]|nr:hypothetical protein [Ktedonobacteraceae bacterium]